MLTKTVAISCLGSVYYGTNPSEFLLSFFSLYSGYSIPSEVVVVIDGPVSAELQACINWLCSSYGLKTVSLESNRGLGPALSAGLSHCSNEYVVRFDTDDINHPDRIGSLYSALDCSNVPRVDIVTTSLFEFIPGCAPSVTAQIKNTCTSSNCIKAMLGFANSVNHPAVAFRRSSILEVGSYDDVKFFEDYYLWLKCRKAGLTFLGLRRPLVYMRRPNVSVRRSGLVYAKCEFNFLSKILLEGLIHPILLPVFLIRISLRILPARLQGFQSLLPWRNRSCLIPNPDFSIQIPSFGRFCESSENSPGEAFEGLISTCENRGSTIEPD